MVSWSTKRQFIYVSIVLSVFIIFLALPTFFIVYKAPSCTDGKQNQNELGTDCGGPCSVLCRASALDLIVHWQRAFKVKDGIYNVLAYVENPNLDSGVNSISYIFKLYDKDNVLIYERRGQTFVPPKKIFGIFESNIITGTRVPATVFFEFSQPPVWTKEYRKDGPIAITGQVLSGQDSMPRLSAILENRSFEPMYNTEVVAVIYGPDGNAVGASRTIVDSVEKGASTNLTFTWPEPFSGLATRIELLSRSLR
ncbi:MAG: hypothetical protein AAB511_00745 [Patescibacteria group bacterium]